MLFRGHQQEVHTGTGFSQLSSLRAWLQLSCTYYVVEIQDIIGWECDEAGSLISVWGPSHRKSHSLFSCTQQDVGYALSGRHGHKSPIITGITGFFEPGEMAAVVSTTQRECRCSLHSPGAAPRVVSTLELVSLEMHWLIINACTNCPARFSKLEQIAGQLRVSPHAAKVPKLHVCVLQAS